MSLGGHLLVYVSGTRSAAFVFRFRDLGLKMIGEQVDDNGESYWIFESRDVRIHLLQSFLRAERSPLSLHGLPILSTLGECFPILSRLLIGELKLPRDSFGPLYTSFRPSGLVSFLSPCSSSTYRQ
jgi:hypothetical protein